MHNRTPRCRSLLTTGVVGLGLLGASALPAAAQSLDDVTWLSEDATTIVGQAPAATETGAARLQEVLGVLAETGSAEATWQELIDGAEGTTDVLLADHPQHGFDEHGYWDVATVVGMEIRAVGGVGHAYMAFIDDPSSSDQVLTPEDVEAALAESGWFVENTHVAGAVGSLVTGNLWSDPYGFPPGVYGALTFGWTEPLAWALRDTNLEQEANLLLVSSYSVGDTVGPMALAPAEATTAPVFDLTNPIYRELVGGLLDVVPTSPAG